MKQIYANNFTTLSLGRRGENLALKVVFDVQDLESLYGPGNVEVIYQRPGDAQPYPLAVQREETLVTWDVTATDTEMSDGSGKCELRYYVGETLAKSKIWRTWVEPALPTPSDTAPPEPEQGWVEQVVAAGVDAKQAAERAENAVIHAPIIGENGDWFVWDSTTGTYIDTGRYSGGSAPYIGANGNWFIGTNDSGVSATGPAGPSGRDGADGQPGRDGRDGIDGAPGRDGVDGLPGEKGDPFRYEDFTEEQLEALRGPEGQAGQPGRDGIDGKDGQDGYTPKKGVDYFDGAPGKDGTDGKDGYTPQKGKDYFTPDEITEIEQNAADKIDVSDKLTQPSNAAVGQIFKVQAINEDGTLVLEAIDLPSGGTKVYYGTEAPATASEGDLFINTSSSYKKGEVSRFSGSSWVSVNQLYTSSTYRGLSVMSGGMLAIAQPSDSNIDIRNNGGDLQKTTAVTLSKIDYAVKTAMCDGLGNAWTDAERLAALLRMGCTVDENGFVKWAAQEVTE